MPGRYLKRKKHNWLFITILPVLAAACVLPAVLLHCTRNTPEEPAPSGEPVAQTSGTPLPSGETEPEPTKAHPEPSTEDSSISGQPDLLTDLLDKSGISYEELAQKNCTQLITVVSSGTSAKIHFFSCREGIWEELPELYCLGHVGRNGVGSNKREGDGRTPAGLFGIGSAFYISDLPETKLDIFRITEDTYWVDDPDSAFYNQKVEGTQNKDWSSAEHMISYDAYLYGFVVEYNPGCQKDAGSAIFFHIGSHSTAGCVAAGEDMVLGYLKELDQERCPHILIVNGKAAKTDPN